MDSIKFITNLILNLSEEEKKELDNLCEKIDNVYKLYNDNVISAEEAKNIIDILDF